MLEEPARIYGDQLPLTIVAEDCALSIAVVTATHLELAGTVTVDGRSHRLEATAMRLGDRWQLVDAAGAAAERQVARRVIAALSDTDASPAQMRRVYELAARNRDAMADGLRKLHTIAAEHATRQEALARALVRGSPRQQRALAQAQQRRAQASFLASRIENLGGDMAA